MCSVPVGSTFNIQNSIPHKSQKTKAVPEANRAAKFQRVTAGSTESIKEAARCSAEHTDICLGAGCRGFKSLHSDHNWTPVLIQCVSKRVSSFFLQKPLFTRVFLYLLTITGSTVVLKWSPWSLFRFTPLYHLTKGLWGVHFEPRDVYLSMIYF